MSDEFSINEKPYDAIIIGTGLGSLSYAALLVRSGKKVIVFEKASEPGGCASSYSKDGIRYEAGATTLVGLESGLPLYLLLKELGIPKENLPLILLPTAMKVNMGKNKGIDISGIEFLTRNNKRGEWIEEVSRYFGEAKKQKRFWSWMFYLSDHVWDVSSRLIHFPFHNIADVFKTLLKLKWKDFLIFSFSIISIKALLKLPGFPKSKLFKKFLDEQLLITAQTTSESAPVTLASAGLSYAHLDNYYLIGGMGELAGILVNYIESHKGKVHFREEVNVIAAEDSRGEILYSVHTRKNKTYLANSLISGIPIWNLPSLIDPDKNLLQKKLFHYLNSRSAKYNKNIWGAFNISILVEDFLADEECIHFQFHLEEELPYGLGKSIFISVSHKDDQIRCRNGQRVLAVSTHASLPENWDRKEKDYTYKKQEIILLVIKHLESNWNGFSKDKIIKIQAASPATWQIWTGRYKGRVGGIPASYFRNLLSYPSSFTSLRGFYLLGDTVYPGQGIPGVVLGALNLFKRLG
ncbi:MAG: NAD(P)-binding protein [Leptospira sp.]|nr:NAD(P)-binding protein [Leptospira sp.]NCS93806.1 NAD(P)-binding protein [Leptospira sp.]